MSPHLTRQVRINPSEDGTAEPKRVTGLLANYDIAAKAALRRKKTHQHSLDQTEAQITTLEEQVNAIESANINRETLAAMERAGAAMKDIHGKLTVDKVDETMCVSPSVTNNGLENMLTFMQGGTPRTERTQRRDCQRHYIEQRWQHSRRGRAGRRVGGSSATACGRANAQDWKCTRTQLAFTGKCRA